MASTGDGQDPGLHRGQALVWLLLQWPHPDCSIFFRIGLQNAIYWEEERDMMGYAIRNTESDHNYIRDLNGTGYDQ